MSPKIHKTVSSLIGHTPLFELVKTPSECQLLLKLEQYNPTGSAKIRMAKSMVEFAERNGDLLPGGTIIESTSGNTGQGLAVIARENGYRFIAVVDHHSCADKLRAMQATGAELVYVGSEDETKLSTSAREDFAEKTAINEGWHFTKQHDNPANSLGYYAAADEILEDLGRSPSHIISAVGTGGSLFGVTERLKERGYSPQCIGVEPEGSIAFGGPAHDYAQSGTGTPLGAIIGTAVRYDLLDRGMKVGDCAAFAACRAIARTHGLLLGGSAGGAVVAALELLPTLPDGSTTLTMVCDGGEKYLDTVFNDSWMKDRGYFNPVLEDYIADTLASLAAGRSLPSTTQSPLSSCTWRAGEPIPSINESSPSS